MRRDRRIIISLILTAVFFIGLFSFASEAAAKNQFVPCQYKNSYKYYLEKGDDYLADNQPESAMECYKRALIIQPTSKKARERIIRTKRLLSPEKKPARIAARRRAQQVERAIRAAEASAAVPPAGDKRRAAPYRYKAPAKKKERYTYVPPRMPKRRSVAMISKKEKARARELDLAMSQKYKRQKPYAPADMGKFYDNYIDPIKFSNGIDKKLQQSNKGINSRIAPARVTGEYRITTGFTEDDVLWKDANADYHNMPGDTSWRYIFGKDRHNSYDKKIYSRLKLDIDYPITDSLDSHNEIVIDPWTFVGKKRIFVTGSGGDSVEMNLKYWSNVSRTLNETYRSQNGDIINIQESKVNDGKTSAETYTGLTDWGSNRFSVPQFEIDRMYVPIRESVIDYTDEPYHARIFFKSGQDEALTSDDPLRLSNNKIWWEESPWLDEYEPSRVFNRKGVSAPVDFSSTREPLKKGQWIRARSFVARDSDDQRLTFLRGASFNADFNGTSVSLVAATPRNLWDTYDQATSIPAALRVKTPITQKMTLGGLYTMKAGLKHNSLEALNNTYAIDASYMVSDNTELLTEAAVSTITVDEANSYDNDEAGYAGMIGIKNSGPLKVTGGAGDRYEISASYASMDDRFFPGLSNYRFTRREFEFAKHIYFDEKRPENEAVMFGDGMDIGRNSFSMTAKAEFPENNIDTRFDLRTVHSDGGDFIENAYRGEAEYKVTPNLTLKGLAYYLHLPETTKGIDPLINAKNSYTAFTDYFAYEDKWLENTSVEAGSDPSIASYSAGLDYRFTDYLRGSGIFETTNDPKDWPRGLLNNVYVSDEFDNGVIWDKVVPFLYNQSEFGVPPYSYYNIYKGKFTYNPFKPVKVILNYVYNENKYAMAIDGNSTHQGVEVVYEPSSRLKLGLLYQYTRQRDLYKEQVLLQGHHYDGHHNIFSSLDYQVNQDQHLTLMFGEYVGYNYNYPEEHDSLTALDTRHIVTLMYTGTWGKPQNPRAAADTSFTPLGPLNPAIPGAKFVTNLYLGEADYQARAEISAVESDWDAYFGKLEFGIDAYDMERWEGHLRLGLLGSFTKDESWDIEGSGEYQRNDMNFRGSDVDFAIGWAITGPDKYIAFTPMLNAGYRRIEFERVNFNVLNRSIAQLGEVNETDNVSFLGIGGRIDIVPLSKLSFHTSGYWAPAIYAPVNNEALGRITADEGAIWHGEGGCDYYISDRFNIEMGGFWDLQHLKRSQRIDDGAVNAEIPDSKLTTLGLRLGGSYKF